MTTPVANNALHTGTVGTDAKHARLAMGGLLAVQGPGAMDVRTGVLIGPGSTTLLTGTPSTAPMKIAIGPHHWVTSRGSANGPYLGVFAAAGEVTIEAAPGSGTRIDVVWEKQEDETEGIPSPDAQTRPLYGVTKGLVGQPKQPIPLGATELGTVTVSAGAMSTNGANVTIANTVRQTAARGVRVPVRNQAERDALDKFPSLEVYRLDNGGIEGVDVSGTDWITIFDPTPDVPAWTNFTPIVAARMDTYSAAAQQGGGVTSPPWSYRAEGRVARVRGWTFSSAGASVGNTINVQVPTAVRPSAPATLWGVTDAANPSSAHRLEMGTDGFIYAGKAIPANTWLNWDGVSWPLP